MNLSICLKSFMLACAVAASSVLNAQQNVYLYNEWTGESFLMSGSYPLYTYVGNVSNGGLYFNAEQWCNCGYENYAVQSYPSGTFNGCCSDGGIVPPGYYLVTLNWETGEYSFDIPEDCFSLSSSPSSLITGNIGSCDTVPLVCTVSPLSIGWNYQWRKNGQPIAGATAATYNAPPSATQTAVYTCTATCPETNQNVPSNGITLDPCYNDISSPLDYMLVQNVTTTGNVPGQSIQVQFDLSWGNTWKDDINWDAAWVFMKYKNAQGEWKHAKLSPTGHDNGQGTPNVIEPTSDQMGAFIRLATEGQGNFNAEGLQLRWNYSAEGLASVSGLEIRVFAIEMVYHPQGGFTMNRSYDDNPDDGVVRDFFGFSDSYRFNSDLETPQWQRFNNRVFAPGFKSAVINERLSPSLSCAFPSDSSEYYFYYPFNSDDTYNNQQFLEGQNNWPNIPQAWGFDIQMRIKGDAGIDTNNDGVVDNTQYPTGYYPFYAFKYEVSEQQYADFFNCLTSSQRVSLGLAGSSIAESNGQYYAAYPNRSCRNANPLRLAAYADFTGLRPMTYLELHKAFNGNSTASRAVKGIKISNFYYDFLLNNDLWVFDDYFETNDAYGAGVFGCVDLVGNNYEPYVSMSSNTFTPVNGDGVIGTDINNVSWPLQDVFWGEPLPHPAQIQGVVNDYFFELRFFNSGKPYESFGFRLCRSAE